MTDLHACANALCRGLLAGGRYCCGPCGRADEGGWEIHESGPLAHTGSCVDRQRQRGVDVKAGPPPLCWCPAPHARAVPAHPHRTDLGCPIDRVPPATVPTEVLCPFASDGRCPGEPTCPPHERACVVGP